ncbi:MAG: hypothetical protein MR717_07485 [Prevotella sp.]|nr:hypothetical protein [Prevotella sp.]
MKKFLSVVLCVLSVVAMLSSCEKKIQKCRVAVKSLNDSVMVAKLDKYDIEFNTVQARFLNGVIMAGDSAEVDYVGDLREKKAVAVIVSLIPPKPHYIKSGYDPSKKLEMSPMSENEEKEMDAFIERAKKHGH